jgi:hypothetical protein
MGRYTFKAGIVALLTVACVLVFLPARSAQGQAFTGSGTWVTSDGSLTGTWQATFDVGGQQLSGDISLGNLPGLPEGKVDGTWSSTSIDFGVMYNAAEAATFDGTLTGLAVAGTFTTTVGVGGQWQGQFTLLPDATATSAEQATPPPDAAPTDAPSPPAADVTPTVGP